MSRLPILLALTIAGSLTAPDDATAASRFEPPTLVMTGAHSKVAVATVEPGPDEGKIAFTRRVTLSGEVPERWVARIDPAALSDVAWGERYVVGYTEVRRNPLDRETREIDPDGPRVLDLPVVGPALLADSEEIRSLFSTVVAGETEPGRAYLASLLFLLAQEDARTRRFAASELYLRQTLYPQVLEDDLSLLGDAIADPSLGFEPRAMLLEASRRFPQAMRQVWPSEVARVIVANAEVELDLNSTEPLLVKTALDLLAQTSSLEDAALLARQFGSNSPGVAKAALAALELLDPTRAAERARELLESGADLHPTVTREMERFLERHGSGQSG